MDSLQNHVTLLHICEQHPCQIICRDSRDKYAETTETTETTEATSFLPDSNPLTFNPTLTTNPRP